MSSIPCNNCRRSKKKCDRGTPCSRCKTQSVECVYNEVNLFKRGGATKVAKMIDRAQKLQYLLEKVLKNDIKYHYLDINKIISHWNNIKLEMTDYRDLNLPLAVAWYQIEVSLPTIASKSSTLVKSPSNYHDAVTLLNIYITYLHPVFPFINPKKLHLLLHHSQFENPLLTSTLCRAQIFWFAINNFNIPNLEEIELYRVSICNTIKNEATVSLDLVQTYINLTLLELHQRQPTPANKHLTLAVYKSHHLDLHNVVPSPLNPESEEKGCVWSLLCYLDFLCVLFLKQSPLIRVDPKLNMNSYSVFSKYDKDRIFQSVSYGIMSQYEACVKLSWDFPKIKREFHPQKTSESTILHLIEILTRTQTFVSLHADEEQLKLVNSKASAAQLGRLSIFAKCGMLIIDLCEILARYYLEQPDISAKYREIQRECSLNLIENLFPQLTQPQAHHNKNLEYFDFIDPIFPQGAFHACKILLEDSFQIPEQYFGLSYKLCVQSTKLFKCNWLMMKYFERFKEHPYMIHLNTELEADHSYLTPAPSSTFSLLTSSSV